MKKRLLSLGLALALIGAVGFGTAETAQAQGGDGGDAFKRCVDITERAGYTFPQAVQFCSTGGRR